MKKETLRSMAYAVCSILGIALLGYLFMRYIFGILLPFLVAWAIAFFVRPPAAFISKHTHIPVGIVRLILTLLSALLLLGLIGIGIWQLSVELWKFLSGFTEGQSLSEFISEYIMSGGIIETGTLTERIGEAIYELAMSLLGSVAGFISGVASAVPRVLFSVLVTLVAAAYFALDLERINASVAKLLPDKVCSVLRKFKNGFFTIGMKYVRSYLLLMLITFVVMLVGLSILRTPYVLLLSLVIAVLDVLPLIGVGTVLIPWSIFSFITSENFLGIGLLVLFLVNTVIRQTLEPRIVGKNLGVHPLVTLILLYVGYSLFGFFGLILVPVLTVAVDIAFRTDKAKDIPTLPQ